METITLKAIVEAMIDGREAFGSYVEALYYQSSVKGFAEQSFEVATEDKRAIAMKPPKCSYPPDCPARDIADHLDVLATQCQALSRALRGTSEVR